MGNCLRAVVALLLFVGGSFAAAAEEPMAGSSVRSLIAGRTVLIETPAGDVPVQFFADGTMRGRSERLAMLAGSASDVGQWWVSADRLCQRWKVWLGGAAECVTLHRRGAAFLWRASGGREGRARISH